ncbi:MAG: hypothetical protein IPI63_09260 [Methanothrix sp.]|uniref:ADP-dependent glucokinase/phosphofructokinase n=1 Tax=Methanothrix sp. TaxID=90426 RepID=UPI0025DF8B94|nr:ADP-dependent glucokinase/phosphofructokinase [Methanothrix sp.]MBK7386886.1 hypothetical protein [Methanothrix sp.]
MNIICAYPVNLDAVYDLEEESISRFVQSADPFGIRGELKGSIRSREDLISSLLHCMHNGSGAEILVEGRELAEEIESSFPWSLRLGRERRHHGQPPCHSRSQPHLECSHP